MAHRKEEKERLRSEREALEARRKDAERRRARVWRVGLSVTVVGVITSLVVFTSNRGTSVKPVKGERAAATTVGSPAPDFNIKDAVSGRTMTLADLRGHPTLLFFSEGANCEACLVQAADLQKSKALASRGIRLVSVSTDTPQVLAQVRDQYGLTTPFLADSSGQMSRSYGMLGWGGMGHPDLDGHAFMLLNASGHVQWKQAYQE